jgi:hypothetical protein
MPRIVAGSSVYMCQVLEVDSIGYPQTIATNYYTPGRTPTAPFMILPACLRDSYRYLTCSQCIVQLHPDSPHRDDIKRIFGIGLQGGAQP